MLKLHCAVIVTGKAAKNILNMVITLTPQNIWNIGNCID